MQLLVAAVGKLKEPYWRQAQAEYVKRLSAYAQVDVREVADDPAAPSLSAAALDTVRSAEGNRLRGLLRDRDGVVALDAGGRTFTSAQWSCEYEQLCAAGYGRIVCLVGGSHGLDRSLLASATLRWSFGPITLPHALARIVLLEQLYRGIRIARREPYHK